MTNNLKRVTRSRRPATCASLLALTLTVGGVACGGSAPITAPEALPSPSLPGSLNVRGTVFEHTMSGMRPLAGVRLQVFEQLPLESRIKAVDVTSGSDGFFSVMAPDSTNFVRVQLASGSPYFNPCPPFTWAPGGQTLDVHVVSGAILSTAGMPPSYPTQNSGGYVALIAGRVVERTASGLEPVSAATVVMGDAGPVADTLTDANGRYLLCSVGNTEVAVSVSARKAGYVTASAFNLPWFGWDLNFELTRR